MQKIVRRWIIVLVWGHSKSASFSIGRKRLTKKVKQSDLGGRECNKKEMMSLTQMFLCPFLQLHFCFYVSLEALIILQWAIIKHIQEAIGASEIAPKHPDPKHYNYTNFPATWFITTCVFMSKSQGSSRLKPQLLTFSNSFNTMWYVIHITSY